MMYMRSFLSVLANLEISILSPDSEYSAYTKDVLQQLIQYVEKCNFSNSINTKFICANFRCNISQMTERWNNREGIDFPKSLEAIRSQICIISNSLYSIFTSDFAKFFYEENQSGLSMITQIIDVVSGYADNIKDYLIDDVISEAENTKWYASYSTEELKDTILVLKQLTTKHINELLDSIDKQKLSYICYILK